MKKIEEIEKILEVHKVELRRRYGIKELGIFGSYVRGEERKDSDLDLLAEFEERAKIGLLEFIKVESQLSDLLGVKVELVEKSALKPRIGRRILKEVIYL
ncbi:MAG: nucleotidyltransferase family protein [Methanophagales archaeon]|nr:nucleotidyltransferase family protein [Methanophagales archaeon]